MHDVVLLYAWKCGTLTRLRWWNLPLADRRHDTIHDVKLQSKRSTFRRWPLGQHRHSHSSRRHYDWWHDYDWQRHSAWPTNGHSFWHGCYSTTIDLDYSWNCSFFAFWCRNSSMTYLRTKWTFPTVFSSYSIGPPRKCEVEIYIPFSRYALTLLFHSIRFSFYCRSLNFVSPQPSFLFCCSLADCCCIVVYVLPSSEWALVSPLCINAFACVCECECVICELRLHCFKVACKISHKNKCMDEWTDVNM